MTDSIFNTVLNGKLLTFLSPEIICFVSILCKYYDSIRICLCLDEIGYLGNDCLSFWCAERTVDKVFLHIYYNKNFHIFFISFLYFMYIL